MSEVKIEKGSLIKLADKIKQAPLAAKIISAMFLGWAAPKAWDQGKKVLASQESQEEKVLSTAEAQGQVGKRVTVEFIAGGGKYFDRSKRTLINEGAFPNHTFTVMTVGGNGAVPASGSKVRATGVVTMREGKPQLVCKPEDVK